MFSQIIDSFCSRWLKISPNQGFPHSQQTSKHPIVKFDGSNEGIQGMNVIMSDSSKELDDPLNGVNQLSSLARIGLEMVCIHDLMMITIIRLAYGNNLTKWTQTRCGEQLCNLKLLFIHAFLVW